MDAVRPSYQLVMWRLKETTALPQSEKCIQVTLQMIQCKLIWCHCFVNFFVSAVLYSVCHCVSSQEAVNVLSVRIMATFRNKIVQSNVLSNQNRNCTGIRRWSFIKFKSIKKGRTYDAMLLTIYRETSRNYKLITVGKNLVK